MSIAAPLSRTKNQLTIYKLYVSPERKGDRKKLVDLCELKYIFFLNTIYPLPIEYAAPRVQFYAPCNELHDPRVQFKLC